MYRVPTMDKPLLRRDAMHGVRFFVLGMLIESTSTNNRRVLSRPYRLRPLLMTYPQRKSPRLQGYDYAQAGAYFVTICSYQREHLFGDIRAQVAHLSSIGLLAEDCWTRIPEHFPSVDLDTFVVMPNHIHGIIVVQNLLSSDKSNTLGQIIGTYKAAVTRLLNASLGIRAPRIWQGRYHDHIIRSEQEADRLRAYIETNPACWEEDTFYSLPSSQSDSLS